MNLLYVMFGGALGSGLRFAVGQWLNRPTYPLGTLTVNILGCFLMGVLTTWLGHRVGQNEAYRLAILVGFLGGFTTFSSFGLEAMRFMGDGKLSMGLGYIALSNGLGLVAVWAGMALMLHFAVPSS